MLTKAEFILFVKSTVKNLWNCEKVLQSKILSENVAVVVKRLILKCINVKNGFFSTILFWIEHSKEQHLLIFI